MRLSWPHDVWGYSQQRPGSSKYNFSAFWIPGVNHEDHEKDRWSLWWILASCNQGARQERVMYIRARRHKTGSHGGVATSLGADGSQIRLFLASDLFHACKPHHIDGLNMIYITSCWFACATFIFQSIEFASAFCQTREAELRVRHLLPSKLVWHLCLCLVTMWFWPSAILLDQLRSNASLCRSKSCSSRSLPSHIGQSSSSKSPSLSHSLHVRMSRQQRWQARTMVERLACASKVSYLYSDLMCYRNAMSSL